MAFKPEPKKVQPVIRYFDSATRAPAPDIPREIKSGKRHTVYLDDLETRKKAYGTCRQCKEPFTSVAWCRPCNAIRFREEFKDWTSGNKFIDELIQETQLDAINSAEYLEWVPFDKFKNVTYIAKGGFSKIYKAEWRKGKWNRKQKSDYIGSSTVALKSLDKSSDISIDFINEVKSYLTFANVPICYGITQDPVSKNYMMILFFYEDGNLRNVIANSKEQISYDDKIIILGQIINGLEHIHDAGKVHRDFHSGNILCEVDLYPLADISDFGLCRPVDSVNQSEKGRIYGVLPYVAPEVLRGNQYTQAADIYSFGILMNELLSEEYPFGDIPHDYALVKKIFGGVRPKISEHVPKFLVDIVKKCWNAEVKDRPTANELLQIIGKLNNEKKDENSEIYSQIKEGDEKYKECKSKITSKNTSKIGSNDNNKFIQTHPQAIYTSRLLNFEIPELPQFTSELEFTLDKFNDQEPNEE